MAKPDSITAECVDTEKGLYKCEICEKIRPRPQMKVRSSLCRKCFAKYPHKVENPGADKTRLSDPIGYQSEQERQMQAILEKMNEVHFSTLPKPRPSLGGKLENALDVAEALNAYFETTEIAADPELRAANKGVSPTPHGMAAALGCTYRTIKFYLEREFMKADQMAIKAILEMADTRMKDYAEGKLFSREGTGAGRMLDAIAPDMYRKDHQGANVSVVAIPQAQQDAIIAHLRNVENVTEPDPGAEYEVLDTPQDDQDDE